MILLTLSLAAAEPAAIAPLPSASQLTPLVLGAKGKGGGKKKKKPHWQSDWYVTPGGGAQVFSNGSSTTTTVTVGGEAGLAYKYVNTPLPRWGGRSRVAATYIVSASDGAAAEGMDVRVGSFIGPSWKSWGLLVGPDLFYNTWSYRSTTLEPTYGAELPITASAGNKTVQAYAGVSPAWVSTSSRRVDWATVDSDLPGFGHEFTYLAGVNGVVAGVKLNAGYQYRITAAGPQQSVLISAQVDGATVWDILGQTQGGSGGGGGTTGEEQGTKGGR